MTGLGLSVEVVAGLPGEASRPVGPHHLLQPHPVAAVEGEGGAGMQLAGCGPVHDDYVVAGDQVGDVLAVVEAFGTVVDPGGEVVEQGVCDVRGQPGDDQFGVGVGFTDRVDVGIGPDLGKRVPNVSVTWRLALRPGSADRDTTPRGIDERMPCQQGQLGLSKHQCVAVGRTPVR